KRLLAVGLTLLFAMTCGAEDGKDPQSGAANRSDSPQTKPTQPTPARMSPFSVYGSARTHDEKIYRALLARPTDVEFVDTPLTDAILFLKDYHNINILLETDQLRKAAIPTDHP